MSSLGFSKFIVNKQYELIEDCTRHTWTCVKSRLTFSMTYVIQEGIYF